MKIGFYGLSHLGIVTGIASAEKGFDIVGVDEDARLVEMLSTGKLPLHEPDLDNLFEKNKTRLVFSTDVSRFADCDIVYVSRDVPTDANNCSDVSVIRQAALKLSELKRGPKFVVILSQVSPGFTRSLLPSFPAHNLYYQVETLIFGRAVDRALHPERFIVGCPESDSGLPEPIACYLKAFDCPILSMRYESAELAKISINFYLVSSVSTTNTLAEVCESIGAKWSEIAPALRLDKRIGPHAYLSPGLGIAGGNLERDLQTVLSLSNDFGTDSRVVQSWLTNSAYRKDWAIRTLHKLVLGSAKKDQNPKISVWGVAYKQDTNSVKNSPAVALLESIADLNVACCDPQAVLPEQFAGRRVKQVESPLQASDGADVLVVMTPWQQFAKVDVEQLKKTMRGRIVIDPYGVLPATKLQEAGFTYVTLGC
jgi:UDPglucose 6-dehydrogenase